MRGEVRLVVDRLVREVWLPIIEGHPDRDQIAGAAVAATFPLMIEGYTPQMGDGNPDRPLELRAADCANDHELAIEELEGIMAEDFVSEYAVVGAVSGIYELLEEYETDASLDDYRLQLIEFVGRYSLRYYVGPRAELRATLPGIVASTYQEFRKICECDPALRVLLDDFEHALAEAVDDPAETRVKTTVSKLFNALEAVAKVHPDVQGTGAATFGEACQRIGDWPHNSVRDAAENLYKFACDYPGIRHAGTPVNKRRDVGPQDLSGVCAIMVGFTSYLSNEIPDGAGLRVERRVRRQVEEATGPGKSW